MEKTEINIANILKYAPKKTKIYCSIYGEVYLETVSDDFIKLHPKDSINGDLFEAFYVNAFGRLRVNAKGGVKYARGECIIFPSKDCRTWENFKAEWLHQHFQTFQKVLIAYSNHYQKKEWGLAIYSHWSTIHQCHVLLNGEEAFDFSLIPYKGNEDKLGKLVEGS